VQAVEVSAALELVEGAREVRVAEDAPGLLGLVGAAQQDGLGVLPHELDALEVGDDRRHRQHEHTLALERAGGGARRRLELLVLQRDPERAQVAGELGPRPRSVVRDEAQPVAILAQACDRRGATSDRLAGDVEDPVYV